MILTKKLVGPEVEPTKKTTRVRLLEVACELIAEEGFENISVRSITDTAKANVAAVNYHFGSKEKLFQEIQMLYILPINIERLRRLEALQANGNTPELSDVIEAFMRPLVSIIRRSQIDEQLFLKLIGRCMMNNKTGGDCYSSVAEVQKAVMAYTEALANILPDFSVENILWRLHYSYGVMMYTLSHSDTLEKLTMGKCGSLDIEDHLQGMIDFCVAGFQAPVTKGAE